MKNAYYAELSVISDGGFELVGVDADDLVVKICSYERGLPEPPAVLLLTAESEEL